MYLKQVCISHVADMLLIGSLITVMGFVLNISPQHDISPTEVTILKSKTFSV